MKTAFSDPEAHEEHRLRDGTVVTLRAIRASDAPELAAGFSELSRSSRRQRFLGGMATLGDEMLHYLTEVDGKDHVALVATAPDQDQGGRPRGLGVARFIRDPADPTIAEPAITVRDEDQGRGVGSLLAQALARAAWERGVTHFRGPILTDNAPVRRLLGDYGAELRGSDDGVSFEIALDQVEGWPGLPPGRSR
jgi:GNAT superfamily N-acetyltransferase